MTAKGLSDWTGAKVRELRETLGLTRRELSGYLRVAEVTVEKWESVPEKPLRSRYSEPLNAITGSGVAGLAIGAIAAPALLVPSLLVAGIGAMSGNFVDAEIDQSIAQLNALKKLDQEERRKLFHLLRKMYQ